MTSSSPPSSGSKDVPAKHAAYVIDLAKKLANGERPGILATVDEMGMPHLRWMATLSLQDWPLLYTITSATSQKLQHIRSHAQVSWMFSNTELNVIVNIRGIARVADDTVKREKVWTLLEDKSKAYFLSTSTGAPNFAVLETEITDIDAIVPQYDIHFHAHSFDLAQPSTLSV